MTDDKELGTFFGNGITIVGVPVAELSDKNRARLAHLEAIEAAMTKADDYVAYALKDGTECVIDVTGHQEATKELHDLIRKGMKDNG